MRKRIYLKRFQKKLLKVKGKELDNIQNKISEILSVKNLDHYKNLRKPLQSFKRVHVNSSYIILFYGEDGIVYFYDYEHHDKVYKT